MSKYTKFNEIPLDHEVMTVALVQSIREATTKNASKYCIIRLSDGTEQIDAKIWSRSKEECTLEEGKLATVFLYKEQYENGISYVLRKYMDAPGDVTIAELAISAPYRPEDMYDSILETMRKSCARKDGVQVDLIDMAAGMYEKYKEELLLSSAAATMHHNYISGLLYHTYRMLRSGVCMLRVYPHLNAELLLSAIALHDIGKIKELRTESGGSADYTPEGMLLGHLFLGPEMITEFIREAHLDIPEEKVMLLKHMIASHHGKREYGAIAIPAIPEAMVLHEIDMIDSRMDMFDQAYRNVAAPGTISDTRAKGLDTRIYKMEEKE